MLILSLLSSNHYMALVAGCYQIYQPTPNHVMLNDLIWSIIVCEYRRKFPVDVQVKEESYLVD